MSFGRQTGLPTPDSTPAVDEARITADKERQAANGTEAPSQVLGKGSQENLGPGLEQRGLPTPDSTPAVDEARIRADKERQAKERAANSTKETKPPKNVPPIKPKGEEKGKGKVRAQPIQGESSTASVHAQDKRSDGSPGNTKGGRPKLTEEQKKAVTWILEREASDYHGKLDVDASASDEAKQAAFEKLKPLVDPKNNRHPQAELAFKRTFPIHLCFCSNHPI